MNTQRRGAGRLAFGCLAAAAVLAAAWFAWALIHPHLGAAGGVLSAIIAGMLVAGPFLIVWTAMWGAEQPPRPRPARAPVEADDEEGAESPVRQL